MPLPLLALGALKGLGAYAQYKNSTATNKDMQRHLKNKTTQGNYTTAQEGQMVGSVAKQAYHGAKESKSNITGNLIAGGMGNSIAGVKVKADVDKDAMTRVTDTREKIEFDEASNKNQARDEYEQWKQQEHERKQQATSQAISSAVGIGTGMITGTGDFSSPTSGMGQFKKQINSLKEGDITQAKINGKSTQVVWDGAQFIPIENWSGGTE